MGASSSLVFTAYVVITDDTGWHHGFAPGDAVPAWARNRAGSHVTATDPNAAVPDAPVKSAAPVKLRKRSSD